MAFFQYTIPYSILLTTKYIFWHGKFFCNFDCKMLTLDSKKICYHWYVVLTQKSKMILKEINFRFKWFILLIISIIKNVCKTFYKIRSLSESLILLVHFSSCFYILLIKLCYQHIFYIYNLNRYYTFICAQCT